ncbi:MAG: cation diffusion facilitator family transporter [bacterium]
MDTNIKIKKRAAYLSLFIGLGMFAGKISAYLITGSSAIFSDAAESIVHVMATSMALFSIITSSKPADKSHLYGYGNIEYFSAGTEGLLIIIAAITIIYYSIHDLLFGVEINRLDTGTLIIAFAGAVNLWLGFYLIRKGKTTNSLALVADGKHVLTDSYTSIAVVVGLVLVLITGIKIFDPIIALFVATNIIVTGYKLMRESFGGLMNKTDKEILEKIYKVLTEKRKPYWIDIHHLKFLKSSEKVFIDFHLSIPHYFTVKESHREENYIERQLLESLPHSQVRIHFDDCAPIFCKYCRHFECNLRHEPFSKEVKCTVEKMLGDPVEFPVRDYK